MSTIENKRRKNRKPWVRLDNASNIFLAAMNQRDTKVYRMSAEMTEPVDSEVLQRALNNVYERYRLFHSVLRRGFFWYYLEESDLKPVVRLDTRPPCEALYHFDRRELLFRVIYWKNRISIEVFHVLADGTGSSWFFEDLLEEYLLLRYPNLLSEHEQIKRSPITEDSFERHFRKKEKFSAVAQSAIRTLRDMGRASSTFKRVEEERTHPVTMPVADQPKSKRVYQVKGTYTPDNRPRVIEMEMPVKQVLQFAKQENVSLTIYLIALFMESVRLSSPDFRSNETVSVSVPVNLRQFFESETARNFFSTTRLEYTYKGQDEEFSTICQELKAQFDAQLTKEHLEEWLSRLIAFEYNPIGRIVPRPVKDLALKIINHQNNRNLTLAISNLGRASFHPAIDALINQVYFHTIAVRPQFCVISHGDVLTISFTSPYIETELFEAFSRLLTKRGIPVTVSANKVTQSELEEGSV